MILGLLTAKNEFNRMSWDMSEDQVNNQKVFIQIIGNAVCNLGLPESFSIENEEALYKLAKHHDMAHLVAYAIDKNGISINEKCSKVFQQQYYQAVRRVAILEDEIRKIRSVFEENGVDFIPLKGAVIRKLYPQEWMENAVQKCAQLIQWRSSRSCHIAQRLPCRSSFYIDGKRKRS